MLCPVPSMIVAQAASANAAGNKTIFSFMDASLFRVCVPPTRGFSGYGCPRRVDTNSSRSARRSDP